eukprot:6486024-Prymnesium_polylepis.1
MLLPSAALCPRRLCNAREQHCARIRPHYSPSPEPSSSPQTFASRYGPKAVSTAATAVLLLNYAGAILTGLLAVPGTFRRWAMVGGHALAAAWLAATALKLDPESAPSVKKYYKQIWNLFYFERASTAAARGFVCGRCLRKFAFAFAAGSAHCWHAECGGDIWAA